ncbi:GspE/PulE family protein [Anaerococcus tetradius]|uniref:GspE/PulE family protein n=1 Tax=Anaerococcus tetradius TaxID=33036 RepID=UPI0023F3E8B8|nr:GspE/PulE family protein [Anaerococcus tetradius]
MADQRDIEKNIDTFIKEIIGEAIELRASDIHIEAFETYGRIRLRVDGSLFEYMRIKLDNYEKLLTKIKLMSKMDIAEKRRPQDANLKLEEFSNVDFRLSTINTVNGEKMVIRILSLVEFKKRAKLLGFTDDNLGKINKVLAQKSGMIIITGPTGSGKSTSLYALLDKLNTGHENIISVEDPVEYKIEGINQVSINEKIDLSFAKALRSILRQDPDIIMIGEIRDKETAQIAIRAAITGHLVLSTLHTTDAISAIPRLRDLGVEDYLINSSLSLLISQRLVKRLCTCKEKSTMTDLEYQIIKKHKNIEKNHPIYRPKGCSKCKNGYLGREAVEEVIVVDEEIKDLLRKGGERSEEIKERLAKVGFKNMLENGIDKVIEGKTSLEEILEKLDLG